MKKKQLTRKLSLNKQTLSQLDTQLLHAIKGGLAATNPTATDPTATATGDQRTAAQCPGY